MPPRKTALLEAADRHIQRTLDPMVSGDVNDSQVKIARFGETFGRHAHGKEDGAILVLRGGIAIGLRDGTVEHRPRSRIEEPVVPMFEPATTLNTGNARSDLTVTELKRL